MRMIFFLLFIARECSLEWAQVALCCTVLFMSLCLYVSPVCRRHGARPPLSGGVPASGARVAVHPLRQRRHQPVPQLHQCRLGRLRHVTRHQTLRRAEDVGGQRSAKRGMARQILRRPLRSVRNTVLSTLSTVTVTKLGASRNQEQKPFNPRPAGPLDFPPPAGGGGVFEHPPPPVYLGSCAS